MLRHVAILNLLLLFVTFFTNTETVFNRYELDSEVSIMSWAKKSHF